MIGQKNVWKELTSVCISSKCNLLMSGFRSLYWIEDRHKKMYKILS